VKTTVRGRGAEAAVAERLVADGYEILKTNWRTRYCEVDIIAKKAGVVYFVEVKYRATLGQGEGLDYITPAKLRQITFAARLWTTANDYGGDWRIIAAAVSGPQFEQIETVELE
jgi:Holliday junction resolvase-like predicted endonuclease